MTASTQCASSMTMLIGWTDATLDRMRETMTRSVSRVVCLSPKTSGKSLPRTSSAVMCSSNFDKAFSMFSLTEIKGRLVGGGSGGKRDEYAMKVWFVQDHK